MQPDDKTIEILKKRGINSTLENGVLHVDIGMIDRDYRADMKRAAVPVNLADGPAPKFNYPKWDLNEELYKGKTWDELDRADLLEGLRRDNPELFSQLYFKKTGKTYTVTKPGLELVTSKHRSYTRPFHVDPDNKSVNLEDKTWDELDLADKLEDLKNDDPALFRSLYAKKFGKYPTTVPGSINLSDEHDGLYSNYEVVKSSAMPDELYMSWDELHAKADFGDIKKRDPALYLALCWDKFGKFLGGKDSSEWERADHNIRVLYQNQIHSFRVAELDRMSWDELQAKDLINKLKNMAPKVYKKKYMTKFGVQPIDMYEGRGNIGKDNG